MSANTDEKFKKDIREAVTDIMSAKEDAERVNTVKALLEDSQKTITDLTDAITNKEQELAASAEEVTTLKTKVEELEAKAEEFKVTLAEAKEGNDVLAERASVAEEALASIAADKALEGRMLELEEAKVVLSGDKREAQAERVRGMNDEEFASYKEERTELRAQLAAELAKEAASAGDTKDELTAEEKAAAEAVAAAATLNVENASANVQDKYLDFAKALAATMRDGDE